MEHSNEKETVTVGDNETGYAGVVRDGSIQLHGRRYWAVDADDCRAGFCPVCGSTTGLSHPACDDRKFFLRLL